LTDNVTQAPSAGRTRASRPGGGASRSGDTAGRSAGTASGPDTATGTVGSAAEGRVRGAATRSGDVGRAVSGSGGPGGAESGLAASERARRSSANAAAPDGSASGGADDDVQVRIVIPEEQSMVSLLGSGDELLRVIEDVVSADFHVRGNEITITGPEAEVAVASRLFEELIQLTGGGAQLTADSVERSISMLRRRSGVRPAEVLNLDILSSRGRTIRPKTLNQKRYVDAIDQHTVVFSIGPAGTGKTYLAMAKAVKALQAKEFNRIILTRPAVEAGERLGFLPGTLYEKIDPYLRPLYDALHDMVDPESIPRLLAAGTIEIAPLAYMRGRTLNDSFIILDEAQNTSPEQMKMFLTRLGFGSRVVVTGDVTQVDLPTGQTSGLRQVQEILDGVEDVYFCRLTSHDVVRHKLVADIVDAYERYDARQATEPGRLPASRSRRDGYRGR
jgi:phosphate starvation-inducible protein PhoH and related proteins